MGTPSKTCETRWSFSETSSSSSVNLEIKFSLEIQISRARFSSLNSKINFRYFGSSLLKWSLELYFKSKSNNRWKLLFLNQFIGAKSGRNPIYAIFFSFANADWIDVEAHLGPPKCIWTPRIWPSSCFIRDKPRMSNKT